MASLSNLQTQPFSARLSEWRPMNSTMKGLSQGNLTFNARTGRHDDLVLALAIAIWRAEGGGMASWGAFELYRELATGRGTEIYIGLDLGQSADYTAIAIVRKVNDPTAEDLVAMPLAEPPQKIYQPGSVEASRTSSTAPVTAAWEAARVATR
jgi:hypothetical protein